MFSSETLVEQIVKCFIHSCVDSMSQFPMPSEARHKGYPGEGPPIELRGPGRAFTRGVALFLSWGLGGRFSRPMTGRSHRRPDRIGRTGRIRRTTMRMVDPMLLDLLLSAATPQCAERAWQHIQRLLKIVSEISSERPSGLMVQGRQSEFCAKSCAILMPETVINNIRIPLCLRTITVQRLLTGS